MLVVSLPTQPLYRDNATVAICWACCEGFLRAHGTRGWRLTYL